MANPYLGEIKMVGFTFAPTGFALCNGQLLSIQQNTALFSLLGTTYGGNGVNNFSLPDLRGRVPVHFGQGAGLSPYQQGQVGGSETTTLTIPQMPTHNHAVAADNSGAGSSSPAGNIFGNAGLNATDQYYSTAVPTSPPTTTMRASMVATTGGSQPFPILQPYLTITFIIALQGIFPARN